MDTVLAIDAAAAAQRPYSDNSSARDNTLLALITYGEGYHNYHHTFQWDYRNGIRWWHFDPTKWLIRSLERAGRVDDDSLDAKGGAGGG